MDTVRVGIDFDNTIVGYDAVFHRVAVERKLILPELPATKLSVRGYLRQVGKEDAWTDLQGYVYGARMEEAVIFPGVIAFLVWARASGVSVSIISHRTRTALAGHAHDLHESARSWIGKCLVGAAGPLVDPQQVHFELNKSAKLARIALRQPAYFIDDLPEVLLAESFPTGTGRILFDPDRAHSQDDRLVACATWDQISALVAHR